MHVKDFAQKKICGREGWKRIQSVLPVLHCGSIAGRFLIFCSHGKITQTPTAENTALGQHCNRSPLCCAAVVLAMCKGKSRPSKFGLGAIKKAFSEAIIILLLLCWLWFNNGVICAHYRSLKGGQICTFSTDGLLCCYCSGVMWPYLKNIHSQSNSLPYTVLGHHFWAS